MATDIGIDFTFNREQTHDKNLERYMVAYAKAKKVSKDGDDALRWFAFNRVQMVTDYTMAYIDQGHIFKDRDGIMYRAVEEHLKED